VKKSEAVWRTKGDIVRYEGHDYVIDSVRVERDARGREALVFDLRPSWAHLGLPDVPGVSYRKVERKPVPAALQRLFKAHP